MRPRPRSMSGAAKARTTCWPRTFRARVLLSPPVLQQRGAESLEQGAIDGVVLRVVFGVPLHTQRESRRVGDADRLDRAVFGDTLDDDPLAGLENALAVQRIHADRLAAEK